MRLLTPASNCGVKEQILPSRKTEEIIESFVANWGGGGGVVLAAKFPQATSLLPIFIYISLLQNALLHIEIRCEDQSTCTELIGPFSMIVALYELG